MEAMRLGWDIVAASRDRFLEKNGGGSSGDTRVSTSIAIIGPAPGIIGVLFMDSDITREPQVGAYEALRQSIMKALRPTSQRQGVSRIG